MNNKREFYRLDFYDKDVTIHYGMNQEKVAPIRDISGRGISFYCDEIIRENQATFTFTLLNQTFVFQGRFVRMQTIEANRILHAYEFHESDDKKRSQLTATMLKVEAKRRKRK